MLGFCSSSFLPAQSLGPEVKSHRQAESKLSQRSKTDPQKEIRPDSKPGPKSKFKMALSGSETLKLAQFHTTRREFKEAIGLWTKLTDQKPDAFAEANLGWSYLQLGDKEKAKAHIDRSIQINPRTIEGYKYLGYYLMGQGKVPDAVKAFRTSMSFDPHHKCNCGDLEKLVLSKSHHRKP